jgi:hypothetical protein
VDEVLDLAATAAAGGPPVEVTIIVAVISSGVVAAAINVVSGNLRANANLRRDRYALAVRYLVAWGEYPYRIRRRTDDEPATRASLANRGHELQEQRAEIAGWIAAENRGLSAIFDQCVREVSLIVGPACVEAWESPPAVTGAGMNLRGFGPRGVEAVAARMERACRYRFGLRRLMWRRWVSKRIRDWEKSIERPQMLVPEPRTSAQPGSSKPDQTAHPA